MDRNLLVKKKRLSFIDTIGDNKISDKDLDQFNDDMNKLLQFGKENIEKGRERTIVIPKKEANNIIKRNEEEIKRQREEALSKTGFLDTGNTVSIGEELRKIKDNVLKMDKNYNSSSSETEAKKSEPSDYSKMQADEMRCEAFGGLI